MMDLSSKQVLEAESSLYCVAKLILHNDEDCADAIQSGILFRQNSMRKYK